MCTLHLVGLRRDPLSAIDAGLKLLHTYTDQLWGMGTGIVPHPSFTPERIFPHVRFLGVKGADGP
jgi:hypothetical protein